MFDKSHTLLRAKAATASPIHACRCHLTATHSRLMRFLEVGHVDVKWLFDHFRNYGIAGALMFASHHVAEKPSSSVIPHFNDFAAIAFALMSAALFIINFIQGGLAFKKQFGRQSLWTYAILAIVWFMLMQALMETRTGAIAISLGSPALEIEAPMLQADSSSHAWRASMLR